MTSLILTICSVITGACEDRKIDLYQSKLYCEKMWIMEAAKIASTFPINYEIKKQACK